MMTIPAFDEAEMRVVRTIPKPAFLPEINLYGYPYSTREAVASVYERRPAWQVLGMEMKEFCPIIIPDNVARGFVWETQSIDNLTQAGGKDMFGVEWVYVPSAMGSMEKPGVPHLLDDVNDWPDVIEFPDVDAWDWQGSAKLNNGTYLTDETFNRMWFFTGYFERLISFMGFENASVAMIDPDQQEAVKSLFEHLTDLYISILDHAMDVYEHIDGVYLHDDWGSARDTFFAPSCIAETTVEPMRRFTDHAKQLGLHTELHSCGSNFKQVPNMIAAGWEMWNPQGNVNDAHALYEQYGDKIVLAVKPDDFDVEHSTEEEQRQAARAYAEAFCNPDRPTMFSFIDGGRYLTSAFQEELYRVSRQRYSGVAI